MLVKCEIKPKSNSKLIKPGRFSLVRSSYTSTCGLGVLDSYKARICQALLTCRLILLLYHICILHRCDVLLFVLLACFDISCHLRHPGRDTRCCPSLQSCTCSSIVVFDIVSALCDAILASSCYFFVMSSHTCYYSYKACEHRGANLTLVDNGWQNAVIAHAARG